MESISQISRPDQKNMIISFDVATKSLAVSIVKYNYNVFYMFKEIQNKYDTYLFAKNKHKNKFMKIKEKLKNGGGLKLDPTQLEKQNKEMMQLFVKILDEYIMLLDFIDNVASNMFTIEHMEVVDLIPKKTIKETTILERTKSLSIFLSKIDTLLQNEPNKPNEPDKLTVLIEYQMGPNDKSRVISNQLMYHFSQNKYIDTAEIHLVGPSLKNKIYLLNDENSTYNNFISKLATNYGANKSHSKYVFLKILNNYKCQHHIKNVQKKNIDDIADSFLMSIAFAIKNNLF